MRNNPSHTMGGMGGSVIPKGPSKTGMITAILAKLLGLGIASSPKAREEILGIIEDGFKGMTRK